MKKVDISEVSLDQLEAAIKKKKEAKKREQKAYEKQRDGAVHDLIAKAEILSLELTAFKKECTECMQTQHDRLRDYRGIRSNSKGGFQLMNSNSDLKVVRTRNTTPTWDERASKGVELIKDFLYDTVKKKDQKLFEILLSFIVRNQNGDLEYAKVLNLIKHRDKYDDQRWTEGLSLIEESYTNILKSYQYEFKYQDEAGKWVSIDLNFSKI